MNTTLFIGLGLAGIAFFGFNYSTKILDKASDMSFSKGKRSAWKVFWFILVLAVIAAGIVSFMILYPFIEDFWNHLATMVYLQ